MIKPQAEPKWIGIANEYRAGHLWDGELSDKIYHADSNAPAIPVETVRRFKLANGLRIFDEMTFNRETLNKFLREWDFILIDLMRFSDKGAEMILESIKGYKNKVWLCIGAEIDSQCGWDLHPRSFPDRNEAAIFFRQFCAPYFKKCFGDKSSMQILKMLHSPNPNISKILKKISTQSHSGSIFDRDQRRLQLTVCLGCLFAIHEAYEWGFSMVWLERNAWLSSTQLGVAFLRGAARQYGKWTSMDFSPWNGASYLPIHYDARGRRLGSFSESLLIRQWVVAYLSGMNIITEELSDTTHWLDWQGPTYMKARLSPAGRNAKRFAEFALTHHPERGVPYAPVALLMERHHGWDGPHLDSTGNRRNFVWGNKVPYEDGDYMIEYFFEHVFPGYRQCAVWYDRNVNPKVPWRSKREFVELLKKGYDTRSLEIGQLTNTPYGDCFDVLVENAPLKVLQTYPVIFLLGRIQLNTQLKRKLKAYAFSGGTVVVSGKQAGIEDSSFLGIDFIHSDKEIFDSECTCKICGKTFSETRCHYNHVQPKTAKSIVENDYKDPMATVYNIGEGRIIFLAAFYSLPMAGDTLTESCKHVLGHLVYEFSPAHIEGPPVEILFNLQEESLWVSLVNNGERPWQGRIIIPEASRKVQVREIWKEEEVPVNLRKTGIEFETRIPAFGFHIFRIQPWSWNAYCKRRKEIV